MIRLLSRILLVVVMVLATPIAKAEERYWSAAQEADLELLLTALAEAPDEGTARAMADGIWRIWTQPAEGDIAERVAAIMRAGTPSAQFPLVEALVRDHPDYAEGWNLRATLNFLNGDNEAALADAAETLKREPRHFGALAGRALIYHGEGKGELARAAMLEALEVHPFLPERALFPELQ